MFLEFKKDKIVDKIDKFSLLLEFSIRFESKIIFCCCCCNIVTKSLFSLVFTKFRNLSIIFAILDCVNKTINKQVSLF